MSEDTARQVAFNPAAPLDERRDALTELQRTHMPGASDLLDQGIIRELVADIQSRYDDLEAENALAKSMNTTPVPFPSRNLADRKPGMHSVTVDELQVSVAGDYIERPGLLQYEAMRAMVEQTPVLGAVINTRVRQVERFCRIAETGELPGFEIRHVDREHQLTAVEVEQKQALQKFIQHCGWEWNSLKRKALKRDTFKTFMSKYTRDSLTMDSAGIELEWKQQQSRGLDGFYAVDGSTIRLCSEQGYEGDDQIFALQVVGGRICTAYSFMDLVYEPRNPSTNVRMAGYGVPEVETLMRVITGFLNAMAYNSKGFDSNSIPRGMLQILGNYTQGDLAAFKRQWNQMVRGVGNSWALPVLIAKDGDSKAEFTKFDVDFSEMHFAKWMTFLTSIICAVYGMSPAEINFDSFTAGSSSTLGGSDTAEKLAASKDSGLYPLLTHVADVMSDFIVPQFGENWCFRWTGLEPDDADKRFDIKKAVQTVDEARAEIGMVAHPDPMLGAAPLNSVLMPIYQQVHQSELGPPVDMGQPGAGGGAGAATPPATPGAAPGADFGRNGSGAQSGDFGDEKDEGYGHARTGDFGDAANGDDFGGDAKGADFGKALPNVFEVTL